MESQFKNLQQLLDFFKDESVCVVYYEQARWGGNVTCPHCGNEKVYRTNRGYKCANKECFKKFSVTVGTIFENSKIGLRTWFAAMFLISTSKKGVSSLQLATQLGITQKTAWFVLHRLRMTFTDNDPKELQGVVSMDETFVGGKNKNRHADKKYDGGQGGQSEDKTVVMGAMQIGGVVITKVIPDRQSETMLPIIKKMVKKGSILVTDEHRAYYRVKKDYFHIVVNHNNGEYCHNAFSTNNIEGFWSLLKRGIIGIYHSVTPKHLQAYCNEFGFRYNSRKESDKERFDMALKMTTGVKLEYATLIAK